MTVYVVTEVGGQYEDKWERVNSVWDNRELADKRKENILKSIEFDRNAEAPHSEEDYFGGLLSEKEEEELEIWRN